MYHMSLLHMSIHKLSRDHDLPLQQALPDVPPAMADAINHGSEILSNFTVETLWETVAKEGGNIQNPIVWCVVNSKGEAFAIENF
ncbi:hypothetical protein AHAS_Ahas06G0248800 [Arachis hypogaea]